MVTPNTTGGQHVCPNCGHCPTCGRAFTAPPPIPWVPYNPWATPYNPWPTFVPWLGIYPPTSGDMTITTTTA